MEITAKQQKQINIIGRQHGLKLLLLHGSYATGKQRPGSDLDIAYLPNRFLPLDQQLALHSNLADVFGDNYERELDLKSLVHTDPLFQYEVARDSQLLFGQRDIYDDFHAHAFFQYLDNEPIFTLEQLLSRKLLQHFKQKYA